VHVGPHLHFKGPGEHDLEPARRLVGVHEQGVRVLMEQREGGNVVVVQARQS
jgi:hypothetical protein